VSGRFRPEDLFSGGHLDTVLQAAAERVPEEIAQAPEEHLLQVDEKAWVAALVERRRLDLPTLGEPYMDPPEEIQIDVAVSPSGMFGRAPFSSSSTPTVPGFRVVVRVPFTGDGALFLLQPNSYTLTRPSAHVGQGELISVVEYFHDAPVDVRAHAQELVREVERYLGPVREQVEAYNHDLEARARDAVRARRERVRRHYEHLEKTGLPTRQGAEAPATYISDVIVRRPERVPPSLTDTRPMALEPTMGDAAFEDILDAVRRSAASMEASPATYAGMGEEGLRQIIRTALNAGPADGRATAETFNFTGKTDILVPDGLRNIFIAECKIWSGPKGFTEAVDQLFRYAAWRDTKLALIVFIRQSDLTSVVEKGREALALHPQFVETGRQATETELRATMRWQGDDSRLADLNVFFIHLPEAA
jgi:hypothetical protein